MTSTGLPSRRPLFPRRRPPVVVSPSRAKSFAVDNKEVAFAAIPQVGSRSLMAWYDPPDWRLTSVTESHSARPARVHDVDCVEIETADWEPDTSWVPYMTFFARLTDKTVETLATSKIADGRRILSTFLDEGFDYDWRREDRRQLRDSGRLAANRDGSYRLKKPKVSLPWDCFASGVFRVNIGLKAFTCLRIVDLQGHEGAPEKGEFIETFRTKSGRTVLMRRYNGRLWGLQKGSTYAGPPWDERFPKNRRIVIDGITYVHWYDCLTHVSLGLRKW